ncbi:peptide/nickel transport system substrate-binding protein [Azospirillum lipoferum]|uniref:ABC transporter substrate-binding protein n=1 Tax=Azospirillum lipoferum TaxID=193 RepID=A0A5A9GM42_AZOLI|nr:MULTISPECIES: ABC transporter substrate-binding protein [Azospirillum]KAA0594842.1 ABC transporter substrate-binding protein [Azospirillum lipoferum]MCP1612831.1 peptide/nickel transport system substrate-binding protein [Azospirillum lipoferum]MDW5532030.1 ABC transporter substrate-binding protein [Azospirillum sp. NL1]
MSSVTRRLFLAGTAGLGALPTFGLSGTSPAFAQQSAARRGGVLRISVDQAASVIHPLRTRVNPEYLVAELLYSGLTRLAAGMKVEPDLAESWAPDQTLTEWTFVLRQGLTFHDGSPCTAADVVATFTAILDPKTASPGRTNVGPIKEVVAKSERTVLFRLTSPYADLPVALAYTNARIVPAKVIETDLDSLSRSAVGTGPFKLVSFEPDRKIVVERNPAYYDPARPYLDRVEVLVYPDRTAEASALISGDIDLMLGTAPGEYQRLEKASGVKALRVPSGQFLNVNMGCDQKPFSDPRVRKALALSIDREAMVGFVAGGYGTPGNDTPISPAYRFYREQPLRKADLAQAKKLLAEAGYPNGVDLTMIASDKPGTRTELAVAIREMAKPAGFRIQVQTMPHATYLDQVWKKGNFYVGFYNMQATADAVFSLLYTSDAAWNETRWNNKDFDALVAEARAKTDEAERAALYAKAQQLMHDEVPSVIPVFFDLLAARRDYIEGYDLHPRGSVFRLDFVSLGAAAPPSRADKRG